MGEMAEMMTDGTLCNCCGVYLERGKAQGVPRWCDDCKPNTATRPKKAKQRKTFTKP